MSRATAEGALREALDRLEDAGEALRRRSREELAAIVAEAWERIADPERALGREARVEVPKSSGLSLPMTVWALESTLRGAREALAALASRMDPPPGTIEAPGRLSALILAGNVFTACVQPLSAMLLARSPILIKASSRDDVLPRLFVRALAEVDPQVAEACLVVSIPRGTPSLEASFLSRADVVSAYGSDDTLRSLRSRLDPKTAFVMHGNGLGLGLVRRGASLEAAARAFALDVAAYDQRGCLSPHAIAVERGVDGPAFTKSLSLALEELAVELPRGSLAADVGASQVQWRGVALARGTLHERGDAAVSFEGGCAPRLSPGWRNVMVHEVEDAAAFAAHAASFGVHLKAVGIAGDAEALELTSPSAPRVCPAGRMQIPGLLALADGRPCWEGLTRYREITPR